MPVPFLLALLAGALFAQPAPETAAGRPLPMSAGGGTPAPEASDAGRTITLAEAVRLATLNDARVLSAEQDTIIAEQRVKEALFQFLPEVGLQASASKFEARYPFALSGVSRNLLVFPGADQNLYSGSGYMYLPLYEGMRHVNTFQLAKAAQKAARSNYDTVRREVGLNARETFYRLLLAQEKLAAAVRNEAAAKTIAADQALGAWDRIEAEALLGEARAEAAHARHAFEISRLALLKTLNLELDTTFRVEGALETKPLEIDIDKTIVWAIELRPELQSQTYAAEMDAISVNLAMGRRHPTLFFAGDYELTGHRFPLKQNNWDATLGIKIPLAYDLFTQVKQKEAEQRQGALKRAELQDRVRLDVRQAYENLRYWQKEYPLRESHHLGIQRLFDQAASLQGAALPKIRAAKRLSDARLAFLESVTEHILAVAKLEWAVGREL
ncbi:MAG: TolC family protein [Elusimicrobia bacterium]|nr:TolC family protein [Elusimicrobiota bacterium]